MHDFFQDVRYGWRMLAKHPGVTLAAVAILALGIGANSGIFSLIHATLLRPVPGVERPDEIVRLVRIQNGREYVNFGYPDYADYRDQTRILSGLVAERTTAIHFAGGIAQRITGALVTGNYFGVLGVHAADGRLLKPDDDRVPGAHPVAVISDALWQRAFGRDASIPGRTIILNVHPFTVVGVAAPEFRGSLPSEAVDVWIPMMMQAQAIPRMGPDALSERAWGWLSLHGRLRPGVRAEQAGAEIQSIARSLERAYPRTNLGRSATIRGGMGLYRSQRDTLRRILGLLFAAVGLLLLIASSNVANLFLARAAGRRREIAVRLALGSSRGRLVRQLLTENVLLAVLAGSAGLLVGSWTVDLVRRFLPSFAGAADATRLDLAVIGFTLLVSLVTAVLFGLAPALAAARTDVVTPLKESATSSGFRRSRLEQGLVVAQVALSLVLLIGAGLTLRTLERVLAIDRGFDARNVLLCAVDLSIQQYPEARGRLFFARLLERLAAVPGVTSASLSKSDPARDWSDRLSIFHEGREPARDELRRSQNLSILADANLVAPGYFRTLGIPLVAGRDFSAQDQPGSTPVAIVSEALARRLWPSGDALGKRISAPTTSGPRRPPLEIVGIARDSKYRSLLQEAPLLLYLPLWQNYDSMMTILVRSAGPATGLPGEVQRQVAALDPNLPVYSVRTLTEQVDRSLWQQRATAVLVNAFGALSLLLAAVGLYSVLAHSVARRTREIGIRIALGADRRTVLRTVVRDGVKLALAGVAAGLAAALALTRFATAFLYQVSPTDPVTFAAVAVLLTAVAALASYLPSRAATRVDPVAALRYE